MKAPQASLINAIILVAMGLWAYFAAESAPKTAFVPVGFGVILLALNGGVKKENKAVAHIAVVLTTLVLLALIMPLVGSIRRGNDLAVIRVALMMGSSVYAIVYFIKSFKAARLARGAAAK
jgi:hypothetical protein